MTSVRGSLRAGGILSARLSALLRQVERRSSGQLEWPFLLLGSEVGAARSMIEGLARGGKLTSVGGRWGPKKINTLLYLIHVYGRAPEETRREDTG